MKFADRYLGVPLVGALAVRRLFRRPVRRTPPARIALLMTAAIGDTVLLSAVIRDLRTHWPDAQLHLYCGPSNQAFAALLTDLDRVEPLALHAPQRLIAQLRAEPYDLVLDFGSWARINAVAAALIRAPYTVGFRTPRQFRHYAYDRTVDHSRQVHELENYRSILRAIDVPTGALPQIPAGTVSTMPELRHRRYVVCHLWSGGVRRAEKEWAPARWAEVVARLDALELTAVLTGSADDRARNAQFLAAYSVPAVDVAGCSMRDTIGILRGAAGVISVNTGIMHVAASAGCPTVSLDGPVSTTRWGPVGPAAVAVRADHGDCGYIHLGFESREHLHCMDRITVDDVMTPLTALLSASTRAPRCAH